MRFILAIFAFVVATALIGIGIAERTVLLPPSSLTVSTTTSDGSPYLYIDSAVLQAESGNQTVTLGGTASVFAAYGRTDDVKAWLNGSSYDSVGFGATDDSSRTLTATTVAASPDGEANVASGSGNPQGSDLWLEEFTSDGAMNRTFNLPAGYSLIVATDGTSPAPNSVQISWPLDNSTPLAVPFLLAGAFFLIAGLVLLLLGLHHMRKSQGPRRKPPALPKGKRFSSSRTNAIESGVGRRGRRSITRSVAIAVPLTLLASLAIGSQAYAETSPVPTPEPTVTTQDTTTPVPTDTSTALPTPVPTDETTGPPPAVTEAQLNSILAKISASTTAADAASDAAALATRFTGPALDLRTETYAIRKTFPAYAVPQPIPVGPSSVILPQATDSWPRTVFTIVENPDDKTIAPLSLMLIQDTPRSVYKVYYSIALEPNTTLPPVAPVTLGTSKLANDTKLLSETPADVAAGYADILAVGDASPYFTQFDTTNDTLLTSVGAAFKADKKANLKNTATLDYAKVAGPGDSIALATNQSGAIVALNIRESETAKVVEAGATVTVSGAVAAASGLTTSTKGTEAIYDYQLLFYIPPSGDASKVKLLGFAQGLLSAKELP
ncbi:hypothetical protein B7R54_05440 [Subtercola boreus]|uniref:DUF8094 domain-containing protein n=1 Tax=Subtercola boreus TaxID=120213 RepID=A0A3E0VFP5_9MICO|nr:hypothetical protein [Subtercola boreus]RFA08732.1 hypothetical protein B7R54_05440 [Subtercola boreus]TQL54313.1 hypothetical protein FB464_1848 [Subtercola boreus]